ncbi:MAG TPA: AraC family transcriptional regulator [Lentzea sp.]
MTTHAHTGRYEKVTNTCDVLSSELFQELTQGKDSGVAEGEFRERESMEKFVNDKGETHCYYSNQQDCNPHSPSRKVFGDAVLTDREDRRLRDVQLPGGRLADDVVRGGTHPGEAHRVRGLGSRRPQEVQRGLRTDGEARWSTRCARRSDRAREVGCDHDLAHNVVDVLERLNEAMTRIEADLDGEVDVKVLARIAGTSEYHLRRMFSALAGIPLSEYIRRRKLTRAASEVLSGQDSLLDIAVKWGYGSNEAFARAFKAMHGTGPQEARTNKKSLQSQQILTFKLVVEGSTSMEYRIVNKEAFKVVGRGTRVPLVHLGMNPAIVEFVKGIGLPTLNRIKELGDGEPGGMLALTYNQEGVEEGDQLDYFQGVVTTKDAPEDMETMTIGKNTWAVFTAEGPYPETIQHMWRDVYTQWFPSNSYQSVEGPSMLKTQIDGDQAKAELWIPVTS